MRRLLLVLALLTLAVAPLAVAETAATGTHVEEGDVAHGAEKAAHKEAHPDESHSGGAGHAPATYFGIPGWLLKLVNMILFFGLLWWLVKGPVGRAFSDRKAAIRRDVEQARERREKADRMAADIQARLAAIEAEVAAIHERAQAEGERQKRELIAAAEAEAQKILATARNEVDNRLKHARHELTEYAGTLAAQRAESILREKIDDNDRRKLFEESLRELSEVR